VHCPRRIEAVCAKPGVRGRSYEENGSSKGNDQSPHETIVPMGYGLRATGYGLRAMGYELRAKR